MICRSLRRDTGGLVIRMGDSDQLAGAECTDADGASIHIDNRGGIGEGISCLAVDLTRISRVQEVAHRVYGSDPGGRDRRRQILCRPSDEDKECVGLRRDTPGHAGGECGIDPCPPLNPAQAYSLAEGIEDCSVPVDIEPDSLDGWCLIGAAHRIGDNQIAVGIVHAGRFFDKGVVNARKGALLYKGSTRVVIHI